MFDIIRNLLYFLLDGLLSILDLIASVFPWDCPVEPFLADLGELPSICAAWVQYFLPVELWVSMFEAVVTIWALVIVYRLITSIVDFVQE